MNNLNESMYKINKVADNRFFIEFNTKNQKCETLTIELTKCFDNESNNSLPKLWFKNGYTDRILKSYWSVNTYVKDSEGRSWGRYNIQNKLSEDGKRSEINFDWMFEATEENKYKILNEIYKLFSSATGKSATEEKIDKVKQYAKENNIEVVDKIPEGWIKLDSATAPIGSIFVANMKMSLKAIKSGEFKRVLLLV